MVSNTSELLPEPETPVNTVSRRFGISILTSLRLFSREPSTRITSWLSATGSVGDRVSVFVALLISWWASISDQSSGRAAKSRLAFLYPPIPATGCFHLPFISFRASLCASSPLETISFKCVSCAFMTSSAVSPCSSRSHGPPNSLHVIVFITLASLRRYSAVKENGVDRTGEDLTVASAGAPHRRRSGLRDAHEVARGVTERAVA